MFAYVRGLTFARLVEPREDLISDRLQVSAAGSRDIVEEVVGIIAALVVTGPRRPCSPRRARSTAC